MKKFVTNCFHFLQVVKKFDFRNAVDDWEFILIDKAADLMSVRKKESFWQHKLNTFMPKGLNERFVPTDFS